MVQTVYYLESNSGGRYNNAMKLPFADKVVPQKNRSSNINVETSKLKSKKSNCIKLQPLNSKVENVVQDIPERKFSHRLNPLYNKPPVVSETRKLCSKIPVLQRKTVPKQKPLNDNPQCDTSLSAADRRQKFHQSHIRAAGACPNEISLVKKNQNSLPYERILSYDGYIVHKIIAPPLPVPVINLKNVLPPIKPIEIPSGTVQKSNQQQANPTKSKCLLGEITHFPALCNPLCSKRRKKHISTVPHLPPILPPPAAPPPSISTSLEKEGNKIYNQYSRVLNK